MPVRRVSNRGGNIIGYFPSLKLGRMVEFESTIERDLVYLLDFELYIRSFTEQPLVISYQHKGKALTYTPDFHLIHLNGSETLVECKPQDFVNTDKNRRKADAAREWCASRGCQYLIITEQLLKSNCRVENVKLITSYARHEVSPILQRQIVSLLTYSPTQLTIANVMVALNPDSPQDLIVPILHMAFHHQLFIPLNDAPISSVSPVALFSSAKEAYSDEYTAIFNRQAVPMAEHHLPGETASPRQLPSA